jgi:hypothetical protein
VASDLVLQLVAVFLGLLPFDQQPDDGTDSGDHRTQGDEQTGTFLEETDDFVHGAGS